MGATAMKIFRQLYPNPTFEQELAARIQTPSPNTQRRMMAINLSTGDKAGVGTERKASA